MIIREEKGELIELDFNRKLEKFNLVIRTPSFSKLYSFKEGDFKLHSKVDGGYLVQVIVGTSIEYFGLEEDVAEQIIDLLDSQRWE